MKERHVEHGRKVGDSNFSKGGNNQPLSHKSSKVTESNAGKKVEELVGNLDMVVLCNNKSEFKGLLEETVKEGNNTNLNNIKGNKRLSTWKKSVRDNTCKKPGGDGGFSTETERE